MFGLFSCGNVNEEKESNGTLLQEEKGEQKNKTPFLIENGILKKYYWQESTKESEDDKVIPLTIPPEVKVIAKKAFKIEAKNYDKKYVPIRLEIPKSVKLEPCAFEAIGPADITFEEGRTVIEKRSFYQCGIYKNQITITLPKSVRELEESAFNQEFFEETFSLKLNSGLRVVGKCALWATSCDLPDSICKLEESALWYWRPEHGYKLPEKLEEIGDECFFVEIGCKPRKSIRIPANVKKIGKNIIQYEDLAMGAFGVQVEQKNAYFKSDEKGWLYSKDGSVLYYAYSGEKKVVIPKTVKKIRCQLQLEEHVERWQKVIFPNEKLEKSYKHEYS